MLKAKKSLDILKLSPEERATYNRYLEDLRYEASTLGLERKLGKEEGLEKGRQERDQEIAKALLQQGVAVAIISDTTGLSIEEITHLASQPEN